MGERSPAGPRVLRTLLSLGWLALAPACAPADRPEAPAPGPDILLVTIDTLRADHLGCYGYFRETSPNIDALAAESLLFERAYAPQATTLPSHTTLFTGVYPHEHGVLANIKHGGALFVPAPGLRTLAQGLAERGYRTAGIVSAAAVSRASGIAAGFEHFRQPEGHSRTAGETMEEVLPWLETLGEDETFFLWVHFWDPHKPYGAPEGHRHIFPRDEALFEMLDARGIERAVLEEGGRWRRLPGVINRYDEEILYADGQVGRLLAALRERGRYEETLIVLAGDHGEGLGQHGERGHGCVHEEQLHVPLLVRIPGRAPERLETPLSLADLLPTLLGQLPGLELDELAAQSSGRDRLHPDEEEPSLMAQRTPREGPGLHPFAYVLIRSDWKLYHEPGGAERLFDLRNDPLETTDRAAGHPEIVREMREELTGRLRRQIARGRELRGDAPEERLADPELVEQLRALGYLD